jgi:hypothetical protein
MVVSLTADLPVVELFCRTGEGAKAGYWHLKTSALGRMNSLTLEGSLSRRRKTLDFKTGIVTR